MTMASSAINHKGIFQTPIPYQTNQKSWVAIVNEGIKRTSSRTPDPSTARPSAEPGQLTESAVRDVYRHVARPFLKGTVSNSLLIDITTIRDVKVFVQELHEVCNGSEHLWSVSSTLRRDFSRVYAEIVVSPSKYIQFAQEGFELKTQGKFLAFPSLSPSAEVLKISLSGLPSQYGRRQGGLDQLRTDMNHNLRHYGKIIDSGLVTNSSGVYTGSGYVVLELSTLETSDSSCSLSHLIDWSFQPIDYSDVSTLSLCQSFDRIQVRATWATMPPFCRYCHSSEHALKDCSVRRTATTCFNCHEVGHISRSCPRKNSGTGKKRKTTTIAQSSTETSSTPAIPDAPLAPVSPRADPQSSPSVPSSPPTVEGSSTSIASASSLTVSQDSFPSVPSGTRQSQRLRERSATPEPSLFLEPSKPSLPVVQCVHCGLQGHSRTTSRQCLKNPKRLTESDDDSLPSFGKVDSDTEMGDDLPNTQSSYATDAVETGNDLLTVVSHNQSL